MSIVVAVIIFGISIKQGSIGKIQPIYWAPYDIFSLESSCLLARGKCTLYKNA